MSDEQANKQGEHPDEQGSGPSDWLAGWPPSSPLVSSVDPAEALRVWENRLHSDRAGALKTMNTTIAAAGNASTIAALRLGAMLWVKHSLNIPDGDLPALKQVSASRRSVYHKVFSTWAMGEQIPISQLANISIDRLYHAARLIGRTNQSGWTYDARAALRAAEQLSDEQLRAAAKAGGVEGTVPEKRDAGLATLVVQRDAHEALTQFAERLAKAAHLPHGVSPSAALLFVIEQINGLNDESLDFLWREAHGEVTEEELAQVKTVPVGADEVVLELEGEHE